jgi:putative ABC transport system permease protein
MSTFWQDVRYGIRMLVKSPGFTIFAIAVLSLGIAANTAIFSLADTVLLRALPYRDAGRLVVVWEDSSAYGFPHSTPSAGSFAEWKSRNQVFEDMAAISFGGSFNLTGEGQPQELPGRSVTANLFSVLGVTPELGRNFQPEDDVPGARHVAILSHGLWLRQFGGDPQILGKEISLGYEKYVVIGVMRRGFQFPDREIEIWVPSQFTQQKLANFGNHSLNVVARLRPGVSLAAANANLATISKQLEREHPDENAKVGAYAVPLRDEFAGGTKSALFILMGAVGFVLLIACANIANLLLARATSRRRELAMRLALGASRSRITRQLLIESVVLALPAGAAGLLASVFAADFLGRLIPKEFASASGTGLDGLVLAFTIAISLATGILFGIIPALRVSRIDLVTSLKQGGGQSGVGSGGRRLRDALVVCEVALAIVLLSGAALMIHSFEALYHHDPGFTADHVLVMRTPLPRQKYEAFAPRVAFYDQVLSRVESLPGVEAAGYTTWVPLTNYGGASGIQVEGRPELDSKVLIPNVRIISRDYIRTLQIKLVKGRLIESRDGTGTPAVALINETMARNIWPGEDPIGKHFKTGDYTDKTPWISVVGVVGDVHQAGLDVPARAELYMPYAQQDFGFEPEYLTVRTTGDPMQMAEAIRQQIWTVDSEQPVAGVMPLAELVDDYLTPRQMQTSLLGAFAGLALLLAALGIYGVLSFSVTQRTQEIGVRIALGARREDVLKMILSQGLKLFLAGAVIGLVSALALSRALEHWLYGVSATDPWSFASVTILLAAVTLLACYIPARRAMRVDPLVALRYE